jgi:hypothetical protein
VPTTVRQVGKTEVISHALDTGEEDGDGDNDYDRWDSGGAGGSKSEARQVNVPSTPEMATSAPSMSLNLEKAKSQANVDDETSEALKSARRIAELKNTVLQTSIATQRGSPSTTRGPMVSSLADHDEEPESETLGLSLEDALGALAESQVFEN